MRYMSLYCRYTAATLTHHEREGEVGAREPVDVSPLERLDALLRQAQVVVGLQHRLVLLDRAAQVGNLEDVTLTLH